jgi:hypothetical protein
MEAQPALMTPTPDPAPHAYVEKHPHNRDAKHHLPDDFQRDTKGVLHTVLQRLIQRRNNWDRLECYLDALRELCKERGR